MAAAVTVASAPAAAHAKGQGAGAAEAIAISSFDELRLIGADDGYPLNGAYELTADIDASGSRDLDGGAGFTPIGRRVVKYQDGFSEVVDTAAAFTGVFDGKGHKIIGLYIRLAAADAAGSGFNAGLFGFAFEASIRNVAVAADTVAGYRYVGALVGRASGGVIEGCASSGAVVGEADVGGLAGAIEGGVEVRASYSSARAVGGDAVNIGGLVGSADYAKITGCYTIGAAAATGGNNIGGLAGSLVNLSKAQNSYSMADVSGGGASDVGGLVGMADAGSEVRQCYSAGAVSGSGGVGGLIGSGGGAALGCFWDVERSGLAESAGGMGAAGRTTEQMMDSASVRNLVAADAASWGIANNYPYLKNEAFPRHTITVAAGRGGALSGLTTAGGTVHTQTVNHWIGGRPIAAAPSPDGIAEKFEGWYLAESGAALAAGAYDGFAVEISGDGGELSFSDLKTDVAIEARFTLKTYTLKYVAMSGRGRVESRDGDAGEYSADTLIKRATHGVVSSVTAVSNVGCNFLEWTDNMSADKPKAPARADTALGDMTFRAFFTADVVTLAYKAGPNGRLRVNKSTSAVPTDSTYVAKPPYGSNGPLVEAIPNAYYHFVKWSDGVTDSARVDSAATENISVAALFSNTYEVAYTAGAGGKIAVIGVGADTLSTPAGTAVVTVTVASPPVPAASAAAVADSGFVFVAWSDGVKDSVRNDAAARRDSAVAAIFEEAPISVKSPDRIIPNRPSTDEAAQLRPIKITAAGLAAGPNPLSKQRGRVEFYRQGTSPAAGTLSIFDAGGNFVNKIVVGGINGINSINNRPAAVWDLADANGKPVGAGTYLVKGTLSMKNGTREKIALVLILR